MIWHNVGSDLDTGDLGLTPKDVEANLETAFQLAQAWDCVMLLDDADIFLEKRTTGDIERNAIVSGASLKFFDSLWTAR